MPSENAVKTAKVEDRRKLNFTTMAEILDDIKLLDEAVKDGKTISATGNWSPAQIIEHVMYFVDGSMMVLILKHHYLSASSAVLGDGLY